MCAQIKTSFDYTILVRPATWCSKPALDARLYIALISYDNKKAIHVMFIIIARKK